MLVPPVIYRDGRTTRRRLGEYFSDWRVLLSVGLALLLAGGFIYGLRLAPPARAVRGDTKPVESSVAPANDRNNDDYVDLLRPILGWTEP
jgi:hypothetical protein